MLNAIKNNFHPILFANYLLIAYAFFLPIAPKVSSTLMIGIILLTLSLDNIKERFIHVIQDKIVLALTLFYFMYVVWSLGSEHLGYTFLLLKDMKYILYIIIIPMILKPEFTNKIISSFLSAMFFSELISYAMHYNIPIPITPISPLEQSVPFMLSYTQYGAILSICLGIILFSLNNENLPKFSKVLYITFFISSSTNIFIIGSRIAYILYFISIITVVFYSYRYHLKKAFVLTIVLGVIGYGLASTFSKTFNERSNQATNDIARLSEDNFTTSLGARTGYYLYSYPVIKSALLFGQGTADHAQAVINEVLLQETNINNINSLLSGLNCGHNANLHSDYLDITVQFGIIGLLIFLNIFYQIIKYPQNIPQLRVIQLILVFSMLFISIGSVIFIARNIGTVFILLIALTLNVNHSSIKANKQI